MYDSKKVALGFYSSARGDAGGTGRLGREPGAGGAVPGLHEGCAAERGAGSAAGHSAAAGLRLHQRVRATSRRVRLVRYLSIGLGVRGQIGHGAYYWILIIQMSGLLLTCLPCNPRTPACFENESKKVASCQNKEQKSASVADTKLIMWP